jgi:hypothetical protein
VKRNLFISVGGMNSLLTGWGWEDNDLLIRLQYLSGRPAKQLGSATHMSHTDDSRLIRRGSKAASERANFQMALASYMCGHWQGTMKDDVAKWAKKCRLAEAPSAAA